MEDECEKFAKELYGRDALHFAGTDALEDSCNSERVKKSVDCRGWFVLKNVGLCYSCQGMDLLGVVLFDDKILTRKKAPCHFFR